MSDIFQNDNLAQIIKIVQELNNPKALANANANPVEFFADYGITLPANASYEIYLNDQAYYYFVIPLANDTIMNDEQIRGIQAGAKCLSSVSTIACISSVSCPYTIGSIFCWACASSIDPTEKPRTSRK